MGQLTKELVNVYFFSSCLAATQLARQVHQFGFIRNVSEFFFGEHLPKKNSISIGHKNRRIHPQNTRCKDQSACTCENTVYIATCSLSGRASNASRYLAELHGLEIPHSRAFTSCYVSQSISKFWYLYSPKNCC